MSKSILMTASILLAIAVAIGAFGAHGLKAHLSHEMLALGKTQFHCFFKFLILIIIAAFLCLKSLYSHGLICWI